MSSYLEVFAHTLRNDIWHSKLGDCIEHDYHEKSYVWECTMHEVYNNGEFIHWQFRIIKSDLSLGKAYIFASYSESSQRMYLKFH